MSTTILGTAVITGASTGIGAVYADRLARRGYDLVLVARRADRLQALADRLGSAYGRSVRTLAADLTAAADLRRVEDLLRTDASVTLLLNNAGVASTQPLLEADVDQMEDMITLNVTAPTCLAYAAAPGFVARGNGTIINIALVVAIAPEILNGVYGASKAYVLGLSQSLQHELGGKGVRVQAVLPGATATDLWGPALEHLPKEILMTTEDMVDAALAGLDQGEFATIPALEDHAKWQAYETARVAMRPELSGKRPASRYLAAAAAAA